MRRPERFERLLEACICDFHGRLGWLDVPYPAPALLRRALAAVRSVDAAAMAEGCSQPALIAARVAAARVAAVEELLSGHPGAV